MTKDEIQKLINDFGKTAVISSFQEYSKWKEEKNAHPKSDYESLRKWLNQKRTNVTYKTNITAVKEIGIEWCIQQSKELLERGAPVLHYYTMGKSEITKRIASSVF